MTFETAEKGQDTIGIVQQLKDFGIPNSLAALDSAANVAGVAESKGFQLSIMDVRRKWHLIQGDYQKGL